MCRRRGAGTPNTRGLPEWLNAPAQWKASAGANVIAGTPATLAHPPDQQPISASATRAALRPRTGAAAPRSLVLGGVVAPQAEEPDEPHDQ
ncbi:MAG: hypothetical protein NVSMB25_08070 [Thermoleophilaceae bacterium]